MMLLHGPTVPSMRRVASGCVVALVGIAGLAMVLFPLQRTVSAIAFGLPLLLPVVVGTAIGGAPAAVVGVVAGFITYNFLFTEPYYTFLVSQLADVIGLSVYVLVGAVVAYVVAREQRSTAEARQREEEARSLAALARSLIAETGLDGVLRTVAENVLRRFGLRTVGIFLPGDDGRLQAAVLAGDELPNAIRNYLDGLSRPRRISVGLRDGMRLHAAPLRELGDPEGLFVVIGPTGAVSARLLSAFGNLTALAVERARLAEEATRLHVLEEVDRLRSALIGAVSHDFRTPLAAISAAVSDLGSRHLHLSRGDRETLIGIIEDEARRLDRLVSDLLDMGRIEGGSLRVKPEAVFAEDLIESVAHQLGPLLEGRSLVVEVPRELSPLRVDPTLVEQVLVNLVENALRFGPEDHPIRVEVLRRGTWAEVRVIDHGPGLPEAEWERIFDFYYTYRTEGERPTRTGMGLAICRGYVEAHGGEIWVEASPGGGATFAFRVPLAPPSPGERLAVFGGEAEA